MSANFTVITLFPEMFPGPLEHSLSGKALEKKEWKLRVINMRDFSHSKHHKVDDTSFGGDFGLVIMCDVVHDALVYALTLHKNPIIVYLSPKGEVFKQEHVKRFWHRHSETNTRSSFAEAQDDELEIIFLCGRYEGIDERVLEYWRENHGLIELSLGDFILSGGEVAAITMMDAILRYQTVERKETLAYESFENCLLEYPHYTKPREWKGKQVPEVLLSGHHGDIAKWKKEMSEKITKEKRLDLWQKYLKT
ncbi:MAG: tRNA (guanosine(37)-N1)-methyltransferase TrmD [Alphaproteobacteria bacterium]|nr:MAG: tRNA (guanosine(37)-N1)-methyltransferase TrmD [Alphaproteobacteria bacterium]